MELLDVLDENGEPLIGVSIVVKGTSTGTITDFDGKFSINLPAGSKELVVSYIGYKEQAIIVSGNAPLNIKMVPDTQALDEVVVIGYGTVKKRDLTGAVASVKSEDITMNPGVNPMDALQGKIAGLDIIFGLNCLAGSKAVAFCQRYVEQDKSYLILRKKLHSSTLSRYVPDSVSFRIQKFC